MAPDHSTASPTDGMPAQSISRKERVGLFIHRDLDWAPEGAVVPQGPRRAASALARRRSEAAGRAPARQGRGRRSAKRGAHSPIPTPNAVWPRSMIRLSRAASPDRRPNQP